MLRPLLLTALLCSPLASADPIEEAWKALSISSQNAGYRIHMMGVDAGDPDPQSFEKQIAAIDKQLDLLVEKGVLG